MQALLDLHAITLADPVRQPGNDGAGATVLWDPERAPDRRPRPRRLPVHTIVAATVFGVFSAGLSLSTVSWIVHNTIGLHSAGLPWVLVTLGKLAGSAAGSWYAQPAVSTLVAAVGRGLQARRKSR